VRDDMTDLYHSSYRRLVAQVYAFTTDLSEAQDAVQEAFARALARRGHLSDIDAPEAWLRTVAVNIVKRRWRRKQLLDRILLRERPVTRFLEDAPEPDRADLREALATIPRTYREVIVLHYLADLPVDEVASILEVPVGTVKSRLSRGREALKGLLDDVEAPPLSQVEHRAGMIKTRRRVAQAAAALVGLTLSGLMLLPFRAQPPITPAESSSPQASVLSWAGGGLSLRSLPEFGTLPDLDGTIVEYKVDGQDVLRTDAGVYARSRDGGQTWEIVDYTPRVGGPWGGPWPQGLRPTWTAPRRSADGLWWTGGLRDGKPVLAHSPDGVDWTFDELEGGDGVTATLTRDGVFAFVLKGKNIIGGYRGNAPTGLKPVSGGGGISISGEPIVLPDGRIVITDGDNWQVSTSEGNTWTAATGMPKLDSLRQTADGYVALGLFGVGWVATSTDGVSWQKLPIR
jgi:RNA polymerase sigma-70 factor (sigma-E family)